jgi:hypothetical protein
MAKEELITNSSATIGTTQQEIAKECYQQRSAILITNTSTGGQSISLAMGQEAVAGVGIVLSQGGTYQDSRDGQYMPSNKQINAVSSLAGGTLAIQERILLDRW